MASGVGCGQGVASRAEVSHLGEVDDGLRALVHRLVGKGLNSILQNIFGVFIRVFYLDFILVHGLEARQFRDLPL
jgi:hypothetical protein